MAEWATRETEGCSGSVASMVASAASPFARKVFQSSRAAGSGSVMTPEARVAVISCSSCGSSAYAMYSSYQQDVPGLEVRTGFRLAPGKTLRAEVPDLVGAERVTVLVFGDFAGLRDEHDGLHGQGGRSARLGARAQLARGFGLRHQLGQQREQRRVGDPHLGGVGEQQLRGEISKERAARSRVRTGQLKQQRDSYVEPVHGIGLAGHGGADLVGGAAERVFEQGGPPLML